MGTRSGDPAEESDDDVIEDKEEVLDTGSPDVPGTTARSKRGFDRMRSNVQSANVTPGQADFSTKWSIDRLDEREKRFSFAAAGGAALFAVVTYLAETSNPTFRVAKGQLTPQGSLTIGLIAAGLLLVATLIGRRAPVGFVALFNGVSYGRLYFLGAPFIILAIWLLVRSYRIQRDTTANLRAANNSNGKASAPASNRSRTSSAPASPARAPSRSTKPSKKPSGPVANKRFTPKRPPPPPPKPSRRERKSGRAAT
jgi:hypothetical protein